MGMYNHSFALAIVCAASRVPESSENFTPQHTAATELPGTQEKLHWGLERREMVTGERS